MASQELCTDAAVIKKDMGQVLLSLELAQDELLRRAEQPQPTTPQMTDREKEDALALLRDPALLDRVLDDLQRLGVVGERTNLLLAYLACVSRKTPAPLGIIVQSSSAAGKSSLVQTVLSLVPPEDRLSLSTVTAQSLFYMGGNALRHKVLSVAEDRGVAQASYALKLLLSEGELQIATTGKDPASGRLVTQQYRVEGPVSLMLTTTAVDLDEELLSRCVVLAIDESHEQTRRIHEHQRWTQSLQGLCARQRREPILALHRNAQRLLRPLPVINPHVDALAYGDLRVRARRDHRKLLALLEALALVHQHQRPLQTIEVDGRTVEAVPVQLSDIDLAAQLVARVTPDLDELPLQTRRLLDGLDDFVRQQARSLEIHRDHVRFSRRQLRQTLAIGDTQLKIHLRRLVDAELVVAHADPDRRSTVYALAFDGVATGMYDDIRSGSVGGRSGSGRGTVGPHDSAKSPTTAVRYVGPGDRRGQKDTLGSPKTQPTRNVPAPKEVG